MFVLAQGVGEFYYLGHFGGGFAESVGQTECRAREGCLVVGAEGLDFGGSFYAIYFYGLARFGDVHVEVGAYGGIVYSVGFACGSLGPWLRAIDGFAVGVHPSSDAEETVLHHQRDCAVGFGADVKQEVAASRHAFDQSHHQVAGAGIVVEVLGPVVSE